MHRKKERWNVEEPKQLEQSLFILFHKREVVSPDLDHCDQDIEPRNTTARAQENTGYVIPDEVWELRVSGVL